MDRLPGISPGSELKSSSSSSSNEEVASNCHLSREELKTTESDFLNKPKIPKNSNNSKPSTKIHKDLQNSNSLDNIHESEIIYNPIGSTLNNASLPNTESQQTIPIREIHSNVLSTNNGRQGIPYAMHQSSPGINLLSPPMAATMKVYNPRTIPPSNIIAPTYHATEIIQENAIEYSKFLRVLGLLETIFVFFYAMVYPLLILIILVSVLGYIGARMFNLWMCIGFSVYLVVSVAGKAILIYLYPFAYVFSIFLLLIIFEIAQFIMNARFIRILKRFSSNDIRYARTTAEITPSSCCLNI